MSLPSELRLDDFLPLPDPDLVEQLRAGDKAALDVLFRRHATELLRIATGITGNVDDAQDVVQDVFVGLRLALRNYDERGAFDSWLRAVAVRTALARRRRTQRRSKLLSTSWTQATSTQGVADVVALASVLEKLPEALREVFVLKVIAGYSHVEIGEMLDIRPGTSEVRHFRAIRLLRSLLSETE